MQCSRLIKSTLTATAFKLPRQRSSNGTSHFHRQISGLADLVSNLINPFGVSRCPVAQSKAFAGWISMFPGQSLLEWISKHFDPPKYGGHVGIVLGFNTATIRVSNQFLFVCLYFMAESCVAEDGTFETRGVLLPMVRIRVFPMLWTRPAGT